MHGFDDKVRQFRQSGSPCRSFVAAAAETGRNFGNVHLFFRGIKRKVPTAFFVHVKIDHHVIVFDTVQRVKKDERPCGMFAQMHFNPSISVSKAMLRTR